MSLNLNPSVEERLKQLESMLRVGELPGGSFNSNQPQFLTAECFHLFAAMSLLGTEEESMYRNSFSMSIFLHVRWDKEGVIKKAGEIMRRSERFGPVYLDGTEGQHRSDPYPDGKEQAIWQGLKIWSEELVRKGVSKEKILPTGPAYNTPDEHTEMITLAQENSWKDVVILGNSYQMLRIALGTIQKMKKTGYWLRCYFVVPETGSWFIPMKGPQGSDDGPRFNQLWEEFKRIPEYIQKEDLCTLHELAWYIARGRDAVENGKLTIPMLSE